MQSGVQAGGKTQNYLRLNRYSLRCNGCSRYTKDIGNEARHRDKNMTRTDTTFACPRTRQMDRRVFRWWFTEVVREEVANDNMDAAAWCAMMSDVAASWADRPAFAAHRADVMAQVQRVRRENRPAAV
ncbi:MAG: hypothetical protein Tp170SUR191951_48 [Prokaryotic dsDNA virus sp.]|nr:hypothetical protein [Pseudomonas sp.]MBS67346.1 hypothetical protein [Pseudomonas sp.]QDP55210.1 MAG: hypothetical protein Tp170SUR191951_48 [Prokaryotic dsDNA virus sp.]|tara:strand:- start:386 stop:769 length:384 start_codon:yes stop_codon:yes gene_type:complete